MPDRQTPASVVILAGGRSRRLGRDKALLTLDGRSILARTVEAAREIADDVIVVGRDHLPNDSPSARILPDRDPFPGPLEALVTGLVAARHPCVMALSCDLPFVRAELLLYLLDLLGDADAAVPVIGGHVQPLHAVYARDPVADAAETSLRHGRSSLAAVLETLNVRWVAEKELRPLDPDLRSFMDVDTVEQWRQVIESLPETRADPRPSPGDR